MDKRRWTNASAVRAHYEARDAIAGDSLGEECITVSIDGATGATYKTIRRGAKFREPPVANFGEAACVGSSFTFALAIPSVTEGTHTIWARRCGDTSGWAH